MDVFEPWKTDKELAALNADALTSAVFATLSLVPNKRVRLEKAFVDDLIVRALKKHSVAVAKAFAGALSKISFIPGRSAWSSAARVVELFTLLFASVAPSAEIDPVLLTVAASVQSASSSLLSAEGTAGSLSRLIRLAGALSAHAGVVRALLTALAGANTEDATKSAGAFCVALTAASKSKDESVRSLVCGEHSARFWKAAIIGARVELPEAVHLAWRPYVAGLSSDALAQQVVPELVRMLRRSPEVSAHNVAWIVDLLTPERKQDCQPLLLTDVITLLSSSRDNVRAAGVRVCTSFAKTAREDRGKELLTAVVTSLTSGQAGKEVQARLSVALAAVSCVDALSAEVFGKISPAIVTSLVTAGTAESNFDSKAELLRALGACFARGAQFTDPAGTLIGNLVRDDAKPAPLRFSAIAAFARLWDDAKAAVASAEALVLSFVKLAATAVAASAQQQFVLPLLYAVLKAGKSHPAVLAACRENAPLCHAQNGFLFSATSALNADPAAFFSRVPELGRELATLCITCAADGRLGAPSEKQFGPLLRTFLCLVTTNPRVVRTRTLAACRAFANSGTAALGSAVVNGALTGKAADENAPITLLPFLASLGADKAAVTASALHQSVHLFSAPCISEAEFPLFALAIHHPQCVQGDPSAKVWGLVLKRVGLKEVPFAALAKTAFSKNGLLSGVSTNVAAAKNLIHAVCERDPQAFVHFAAAAVQVHAACPSHEAVSLTLRDIGIYRTPPGQLFEEPVLDGYVSEVVEGRRKGAEELWAEEVRREIAAKKGQEQPADAKAKATMSKRDAALQAARERQSVVEAVIRKRVQDLDFVLSGVLHGIAAIGAAATKHASQVKFLESFLDECVATLFPLGAPLLANPLCGDLAEKACDSLCHFALPPLRMHRGAVILSAVRVRKSVGAGGASKEPDSTALWTLCQVVADVAQAKKVLDAGTAAVFLTVAESVMACNVVSTVVLTDLVSALEVQAESQAKHIARGAAAGVLLQVISRNEVLISRCGKAMAHYASRFDENDVTVFLRNYTQSAFSALVTRDAVLKTVAACTLVQKGGAPRAAAPLLWIARQDPDVNLAALSSDLWKASGLGVLGNDYLELLTPYLWGHADWVRGATALALGDAALQLAGGDERARDSIVDALISGLLALNSANSRPEIKVGVATALSGLGRCVSGPQLVRILNWILTVPLVEAAATFGEADDLATAFTNSGATLISQSGSQAMDDLWNLLDERMRQLRAEEAAAQNERVAKSKVQLQLSCVLLVASLASHMKPEDKRLMAIILSLLDFLVVSSEGMQQSMALHLAPLVAMIAEEQVPDLVKRLMKTISSSKERSERRGAAWGIAGIVKGRKLPALKKFDILTKLEKLLKDKKRFYAREGALNTIECLVRTLGQGFEAYYIFLLQQLLDRYGDNHGEVRAAAEVCAKIIMSSLSASGVRLVLGPLLKSLSGSDWRRKKGGVELLGSMAFISPQQLSSCLPSIVPVLSQVLTDSHPDVQESAQEALRNIGGVISNPEIKQHVPLILRSFNDPDQFTEPLLRGLLKTDFVHVIDAPSLALLMPIVTRAMSFRSQDAKFMSAQIVGNIGLLTKPADLAPYLPQLSEELRSLIIDPSPDIRLVAARAWGNLLRCVGESKFPELVNWLLKNFESSPSGSTRAGSAQALGEVLVSVPSERFDSLFATVMDLTDHVNPGVREGALLTIAYLPGTVVGSDRMEVQLKRLLDLVLRGFADDADEVRLASLTAGNAMTGRFVPKYLELFLNKLEQGGVFNSNWRTRMASLQVITELLMVCAQRSRPRLGGSSSSATANIVLLTADGDNMAEDEESEADSAAAAAPMSTESQEAVLFEVIGKERFDHLLASLYVIRCDNNASVKQQALLTWKSVVTNPPRTIKRVMPYLMQIVVECLGSSVADLRETGGRTLGDLVERLADKVIPTVLPALTTGSDASTASRQGACLGLMYLVRSSNKVQLMPFADALTQMLSRSLLDTVKAVRDAAVDAFAEVLDKCGKKILDDVVSALLKASERGDETADESLQKIAAKNPEKVVQGVIPRVLEQTPVPLWGLRCLRAISPSGGRYFAEQLSSVLPALAHTGKDAEMNAAVEATALTVAASVPEESLYLLMDRLSDMMREPDKPELTLFACRLVASYTKQEHQAGRVSDALVVRFIELVLPLYLDERADVLSAACAAMAVLAESVAAARDEERCITSLKNAVLALRFSQIKRGVPVGNIPGFNVPVGLNPVLTVFRQGIMQGATGEVREASAGAITEVLRLCTPASLQLATVMQLAPIIRILGEKVAPGVKKAILTVLNVVLELRAELLKGLTPQLQTCFSRALQDVDSSVRDEAALALGRLMVLNPRVDPLVNELCTSALASASKVRHSMLLAIVSVLKYAGAKLSDKGMERVVATLDQMRSDPSINADDKTRELTALVLGAFGATCAPAFLEAIVKSCVSGARSSEENVKDVNLQSLACLGSSCVEVGGERKTAVEKFSDVVLPVLSDRVNSAILWRSKAKALFFWLLINLSVTENAIEIMRSLVSVLAVEDRELRVDVLKMLKRFAKEYPASLTDEVLKIVVPPVLERAQDKKSFPVKIAGERALLHLLGLRSGPKGDRTALVVKLTGDDQLQSYVTRVLSKLGDSEDEATE